MSVVQIKLNNTGVPLGNHTAQLIKGETFRPFSTMVFYTTVYIKDKIKSTVRNTGLH